MFCTNCGKEVADGDSFCTSCGARIVRETAAQPSDGQMADAGSSASVATPTPDVQQSAPNAVNVSASKPPKKSRTRIIVAIAAAAVVIVLALLIFSGGGGGYKDYKELVQAYYEAIYKEDANAMIKLFDEDVRQDLKEDKEDIKEELEELKDEMNDYYDKGWNKHVEPGRRERIEKNTYRVPVEIDGEFHEYLYIKKNDKDRYYIDEEYSTLLY